MESAIQSSFIPHDAGKPEDLRKRQRGLPDLLLVFAVVGLAASLALAGAVFLYKQYEQSVATSDVAQLQTAEQQFEPALVQQLIRLDDRMRSAQTLLGTHIAPSALFAVLNQVTLQTISYESLGFEVGEDRHINLHMAGIAQSVNSVALQAALLSKSTMFTNPIFSGINREKDGVHFNLTMSVDPSSINFEKLVGGAGAAPTQQLLQQAPTQTQPQASASSTATSSQSTN